MSEFIGFIPIAIVQQIVIFYIKTTEQVDLVGKDSNIIVSSEENNYEFSLDFTLVKPAHPERLPVEEQENEVKSLVSNDAQENFFRHDGLEAFLSIEEISMAESGSSDTIREGEITAKLLPFPKYFPNAERGNGKRNSGELDFDLDVTSTLEIILQDILLGDINYSLDVEAVLEGGLSVESAYGSGIYNEDFYGDAGQEVVYSNYGGEYGALGYGE